MTTREFEAIEKINEIGGTIRLSTDYIHISYDGDRKEVEIEIPIDKRTHFDLYAAIKKGIRDNIYQLDNENHADILEFKEQLENLL